MQVRAKKRKLNDGSSVTTSSDAPMSLESLSLSSASSASSSSVLVIPTEKAKDMITGLMTKLAAAELTHFTLKAFESELFTFERSLHGRSEVSQFTSITTNSDQHTSASTNATDDTHEHLHSVSRQKHSRHSTDATMTMTMASSPLAPASKTASASGSSAEDGSNLEEFVTAADLICSFEAVGGLQPKGRLDVAFYDTHLGVLPSAKAKKGGADAWRTQSCVVNWSNVVTCVSVFAENRQGYYYLALKTPSPLRFRKGTLNYVLLKFDDESELADPYHVTVDSTAGGRVPKQISEPTTIQAMAKLTGHLLGKKVPCLESDPSLFQLPRECLTKTASMCRTTSREDVCCLPVYAGASEVRIFPLRTGLFFVGPKKMTGFLNVSDISHYAYPRGLPDVSMRYFELLVQTRLVQPNSKKPDTRVKYSFNMIPKQAQNELEMTLMKLKVPFRLKDGSRPQNVADAAVMAKVSPTKGSKMSAEAGGSAEHSEAGDDEDSDEDSDYNPEADGGGADVPLDSESEDECAAVYCSGDDFGDTSDKENEGISVGAAESSKTKLKSDSKKATGSKTTTSRKIVGSFRRVTVQRSTRKSKTRKQSSLMQYVSSSSSDRSAGK